MSSKLEETDCQKHQATIDALKQVAREAQLKLSKKTKDYERLLLTTAPAQPEILELKMPTIIIHLMPKTSVSRGVQSSYCLKSQTRTL